MVERPVLPEKGFLPADFDLPRDVVTVMKSWDGRRCVIGHDEECYSWFENSMPTALMINSQWLQCETARSFFMQIP